MFAEKHRPGPSRCILAVSCWHSRLEHLRALCARTQASYLFTYQIILYMLISAFRSLSNCEDQLPHSAGFDPSRQSWFFGIFKFHKEKVSGGSGNPSIYPSKTSRCESLELFPTGTIFRSPTAPWFDARSQTRTNLGMLHQGDGSLRWCQLQKTARIGTPVLYPIHQTYSKWWVCLVKPTQLSSYGKLPWLIGRFTRKFHGLAMLNYQRVNCWKPGIWKHGARIRNWSQSAGPVWDLWQSAQVVFFHGLRGFTVQVQPRWNRQVGSVFWIQLILETSWNALILARR